MYTGSCFCGEVQYQIDSELGAIQICHCQQCRKAQGGPFASNVPVKTANFVITAGSNRLKELESTTKKGKYRVFCSACGSPIISRLDSLPDVVRLRVGTINEPVLQKIQHHQFVAFKAGWYEITDDAPQYDEYPPK